MSSSKIKQEKYNKIMAKVSFYLGVFILSVFLPLGNDAYSFDYTACPPPPATSLSISQTSSFAQNSSSGTMFSGAWSCTKNFFMGVWDATGGLVTGAWDCFTSPIDCASSGVSAVRNAWGFMNDLTNNLTRMGAAISNLSPQQKIDLICDLVGAISADVAIAILTAGSASAKLALTISKISLKLIKISKILSFISVSHRRLARLSTMALRQAESLAEKGYGRFFRRSLEACPL